MGGADPRQRPPRRDDQRGAMAHGAGGQNRRQGFSAAGRAGPAHRQHGRAAGGGHQRAGGPDRGGTGTTTSTGTGSVVLSNSPTLTSPVIGAATGTSLSVTGSVTASTFISSSQVTKTSNFTVSNTDYWIICNGTSAITVTLPTPSANNGRALNFKNIANQAVNSASSNVVSLYSASTQSVILPATAGSWATLVSDGTNWVIMQASSDYVV